MDRAYTPAKRFINSDRPSDRHSSVSPHSLPLGNKIGFIGVCLTLNITCILPKFKDVLNDMPNSHTSGLTSLAKCHSFLQLKQACLSSIWQAVECCGTRSWKGHRETRNIPIIKV